MNGKQSKKKSMAPLLGKYELGPLLGRGTFAKVYLAHPAAGGEPVAVKVIDKAEVLGIPGMAPRVLREVAAMRRLRHPGVLRLHEVLATRSRIYLVMELAPRGDLQTALAANRKGFPERTARRIFVQLATALAHCHARGVAHRDVKPQNILLDAAGGLKVSDFGLSAAPVVPGSAESLLLTSCGTPAYAAPEVLRRKAYDGAKADAWSCGVVLFVLLSGRLPFDDANIVEMCRKALHREYEIPTSVSPPARRLLHRLLDPNPETRVAIEALSASHPWFVKRSLSLDSQLGGLIDGQPERVLQFQAPAVANAFDIISMSPGLDLSGLFGGSKRSREKRFMTTASPEQTLEQLGRAGGKLGYMVVGKKGGECQRRPLLGRPAISVEMSELAPPLMLVEMRLETDDVDGDGEVQVFGWEQLRVELGDVVRAWHSCEDLPQVS
ncbi:CBL-interacting protein kinase 4-like [Lolium rigidum]|uniref:CBL-interacting protein kinase 4-like n=1 Tax=Lolium rigidum TaxID=89674 RepID=UPI001F5C0ED8|nr:CBL-interacting protein kinase 4-like [Lolium rigidum]XP_051184607.1 CBL-interacting protein kinase 4-like [Lolium perenne]